MNVLKFFQNLFEFSQRKTNSEYSNGITTGSVKSDEKNKLVAHMSLVQFFGAIENQTLHGQDFCDELRTSWSVSLQYSRSFCVYN